MSEKVWTNECEGCKRLRKKGLDRIAEVERGILKENIKLQSQLAESQAEVERLKKLHQPTCNAIQSPMVRRIKGSNCTCDYGFDAAKDEEGGDDE